MTEIVDFCQDDLDEDDVMLLDTWEEVSFSTALCKEIPRVSSFLRAQMKSLLM